MGVSDERQVMVRPRGMYLVAERIEVRCMVVFTCILTANVG